MTKPNNITIDEKYITLKDSHNSLHRRIVARVGIFGEELIHDIDSGVRKAALEQNPDLIGELIKEHNEVNVTIIYDVFKHMKDIKIEQLEQIIELSQQYNDYLTTNKFPIQSMHSKYEAITYNPSSIEKTMNVKQLYELGVPTWAFDFTPHGIEAIIQAQATIDKYQLDKSLIDKLLDPNLEPSQIWEIKVQINKIAIKQAKTNYMIERKTMNIFQLDRKKTIDDIIEIRKQAKRGENVDELIHHPDSMVREFALKHKPALVKELVPDLDNVKIVEEVFQQMNKIEPNQLKQIINMFTEYLKQHNDERLNLQGMQYKLRALEYEPTIMEKSMDINQLFDLDIPIWAAELTPFAIKHILMMKPTVDKANLGAEYMYPYLNPDLNDGNIMSYTIYLTKKALAK